MQRVFVLVVVTAVCAAVGIGANTARAVEARTWSTSDGAVTVTLPAGWDVDHSPGPEARADRQRLVRVSRMASRSFNRCELWKWNQREADLTQRDINALIEGQTLESRGAPPNTTITEFVNEVRNGVAYIHHSGERSGAAVPLHNRFGVFIIAHAGTMTEYTLNCDLSQPASEADMAAAVAFVDAVSINHPERQ